MRVDPRDEKQRTWTPDNTGGHPSPILSYTREQLLRPKMIRFFTCQPKTKAQRRLRIRKVVKSETGQLLLVWHSLRQAMFQQPVVDRFVCVRLRP